MYRARLLPFDAIRREQKMNMSIFRRSRIVVVSQLWYRLKRGSSYQSASDPRALDRPPVSKHDASFVFFLDVRWPFMTFDLFIWKLAKIVITKVPTLHLLVHWGTFTPTLTFFDVFFVFELRARVGQRATDRRTDGRTGKTRNAVYRTAA